MHTFSWRALGTEWSVLVDTSRFVGAHEDKVKEWLALFEQRFSRFLPHSEVNAFRTATRGTYAISPELFLLLKRASELRSLTNGRYDPVAGELLERAGYGKGNFSSLSPQDFKLTHWSLEADRLVLDGPVAFDLGGIGKGYAIDEVGKRLQELGYAHFLVEGGGDMFGTSKADDSPWQIALEYPGKPELAAGTVGLLQRGLAVSDRFRRKFNGDWHHIVNLRTKEPIHTLDGCVALAPSAFAADCVTSGLFLGYEKNYHALAEVFQAEYLVFSSDEKALVSSGWPGELFV